MITRQDYIKAIRICVAEYFNLDFKEVSERVETTGYLKRQREYVLARALTAYFLYRNIPMITLKETQGVLGYTEHTTAGYHNQLVESGIKLYPEFKMVFDLLSIKISAVLLQLHLNTAVKWTKAQTECLAHPSLLNRVITETRVWEALWKD